MLRIALIISLFAATGTFTFAQSTASPQEPGRKFDAVPMKGFTYPYYFYLPPELKEPQAKKQKQTILVIPNNSGKLSDDIAVQEDDAKKRIALAREVASVLKVGVLVPVFPRPETDWKIYTHALDRDSMVTDKKEYARLDLQLVAMIDDLRGRMKAEGLNFDKRVLMNGFSAQGMFINRFTFLHPDRVKAASIGSPGGWPMAPIAEYKGKPLRYPIGTADLKQVAGRSLDLKRLRKVPMFIFLGDKDENDSVVFGDSYDDEDKDLIIPLFGAKPVDRWETIKSIYKEAGLNAEFRLYPGVVHTVSPEMRADQRAFLARYK